jgi:hypothetical protein
MQGILVRVVGGGRVVLGFQNLVGCFRVSESGPSLFQRITAVVGGNVMVVYSVPSGQVWLCFGV